ncbi:MAG: chromosome partitioning protein [Microbacteriaceae bacterium]|nr:chromosome partitioning protein [Microbacteriaceae bacterium]
MELRDYIRVLRKYWILVVTCTLVGVAGGAAATLIATPRYEASTELFVSVQGAGETSSGDLVQGSSAAQQKVRSYVLIANSPRVLDPVIEKLDLDTTAAQLASRVTASSPVNTVVIEIAVNDTDAVTAANIANAVGASFIDVVVNELESVDNGTTSLVKMQSIEPAVVPSAPYSPRTTINLLLGMLAGLAAGLGAAILRTVLDTRIHGAHDVEAITDRPILGGISFDPDAKARPLIVHADPRNPRAESFRTLRTNLQFVNLDNGPRAFVVTSSLPGEAKTTTTANLAIALAETGARVAIIDGDLRLPRLAEYMDIEGGAGLTDVLIGRAELADVLQRWGKGQLFVLPAGRIPPNPSELLGSSAMVALLDTLNANFDYVLVDAPPLLPVTDAAILSRLTAGAIVVSAAGRTKRTELTAALTSLEHIGSKVVGVIMTMLPTKGPDSYGYGSYGAYYGGAEQSPSGRAAKKSKLKSRRAAQSVG